MGIWGTDNPPASIARINLSVRVWLSSNQDLSVAAAGKGVNSAKFGGVQVIGAGQFAADACESCSAILDMMLGFLSNEPH